METTLIVALIAAGVAVAGWISTYRSNRALALRKDQLDLVNRQLSDLYGPLYVSCKAGHVAYFTLLDKLGRKRGLFEEDTPPSECEIREWYHWMKNVLGPINDRREELVLKNCHLILEETLPKCITDFASHAAAYRAVLAKWESSDFGEHYATVPFPVELDAYAERSFSKLKKEQHELLAKINRKAQVDD
jgi:hypothetical protein